MARPWSTRRGANERAAGHDKGQRDTKSYRRPFQEDNGGVRHSDNGRVHGSLSQCHVTQLIGRRPIVSTGSSGIARPGTPPVTSSFLTTTTWMALWELSRSLVPHKIHQFQRNVSAKSTNCRELEHVSDVRPLMALRNFPIL